MTTSTVARSCDSEFIDTFDEVGAVLIPGALPGEFIDLLRNGLQPIIAAGVEMPTPWHQVKALNLYPCPHDSCFIHRDRV